MADSTYKDLISKIEKKIDKEEAENKFLISEKKTEQIIKTVTNSSATYSNQLNVDLEFEKRNDVVCIYVSLDAQEKSPETYKTQIPQNITKPKHEIYRSMKNYEDGINIRIKSNGEIEINVLHGGSGKGIQFNDTITYIS